MDNNQKPTPEELEAEQAAVKSADAKEEEVRAEIINEFGFDEVEDIEKINKTVEREMKHRKMISHAIGQKIKHRTEKEEYIKNNPPKKDNPPVEDKSVDERVSKAFEKRDLDEMELPDTIKTEIQRVAAIQNISVKQAKKDPYIVSKIETYEKEKEIEEATTGRKHKGGNNVSTFDPATPPEVDMSTKEGRETWEEWKKECKRQGK